MSDEWRKAACPHCGGVSGYITNVVFKAIRIYNWGGADVDTEQYDLVAETNPRCNDCGKPVRSFVRKLKEDQDE